MTGRIPKHGVFGLESKTQPSVAARRMDDMGNVNEPKKWLCS